MKKNQSKDTSIKLSVETAAQYQFMIAINWHTPFFWSNVLPIIHWPQAEVIMGKGIIKTAMVRFASNMLVRKMVDGFLSALK